MTPTIEAERVKTCLYSQRADHRCKWVGKVLECAKNGCPEDDDVNTSE